MSSDNLDKAIADAKKIIGKEGKLPKEKGNIKKDLDEEAKTRASMNTALQQLQSKLIALEKAADAMKDSAQGTKDDFDGSNFGLDPKNAKQKKQIADAQKAVFEPLDGYISRSQLRSKQIGTIHKAVSSMNKQIADAKG